MKKKLLLSALITNLLLSGCSNIGMGTVVTLMGASSVLPLPDACNAFNKPDDGSLISDCNKKYNYALLYKKGTGYALIDKDGHFLMDYQKYASMEELQPNYFVVHKVKEGQDKKLYDNTVAGLMDSRANMIIPLIYKNIYDFGKGRVCGENSQNADGSYPNNKRFICYDFQGNIKTD